MSPDATPPDATPLDAASFDTASLDVAPLDARLLDDCLRERPRRRIALPVALFLATCLSTFWTGAVDWEPSAHIDALQQGIGVFTKSLSHGNSPVEALRQARSVSPVPLRWPQGLLYMAAVTAILLSHEMGHFLMALRYRISASLPYFIPMPIAPFGTMGAVIGMSGSQGNRRELFDLGAAGPWAGLLIALPVTWLGIRWLPAAPPAGEYLCFHNPLLLQYLIAWIRPDYPTPAVLYLNQFNAMLMAGWVGILVTGLNMIPVGQLDGGHVIYALLGRQACFVARGLLCAAIAYTVFEGSNFWLVLLVLVILLGVDHPPTANDDYPLNGWRRAAAWASLWIPFLCFPLQGITPVGP